MRRLHDSIDASFLQGWFMTFPWFMRDGCVGGDCCRYRHLRPEQSPRIQPAE
jgi:hypothetical protein